MVDMKNVFQYLEIKRFKNREVIKRIDVTNKSQNYIDRIERGLNINLDHKDYYVFTHNSKYVLESI